MTNPEAVLKYPKAQVVSEAQNPARMVLLNLVSITTYITPGVSFSTAGARLQIPPPLPQKGLARHCSFSHHVEGRSSTPHRPLGMEPWDRARKSASFNLGGASLTSAARL